jgi:hypothetical protein
MLHQLLLAHEGPVATFEAMLPRVDPGAGAAAVPLVVALAAWGACRRGRPDEARHLAERLDPEAVAGAGMGWPAVVWAAGHVAAEAPDPGLARRVESLLAPHRGTGLAVSGLAYLGAVDATLARCARARGDEAAARTLADAAVARERALGAPRWARRLAAPGGPEPAASPG